MSEPNVSALDTLGDRLRWAIEEHLGVSHAEFARRLGVKRPQLSRWVNQPERPPGEASLRRIEELSGVSAAWLRYGIGEPSGEARGEERTAAEAPEDQLTAEELFRHFEGVVRRMGGADVDPGELKLRKLDVVEGLKRLYGAQGGIPGWVYTLEGRIGRDEI